VFLTFIVVFVIAPLIELVVFLQIASWIGLLNAVLLLLVVSVGGVLIVRHQGIGVYRRVRGQLREGIVPAVELVDGLLILIAGLLLIVPGFITDVIGLILLLPPTRAFVRKIVRRRFSVRVASRVVKVVNTRGSTTRVPPSSPSSPTGGVEVLPPSPRPLPPASSIPPEAPDVDP